MSTLRKSLKTSSSEPENLIFGEKVMETIEQKFVPNTDEVKWSTVRDLSSVKYQAWSDGRRSPKDEEPKSNKMPNVKSE